MASIPDRIHSATIRQSIELARYEAGLRARVLSLLDQLGRDLVKELAAAELDTPRTDWQRARLRELLKVTEQRASEVYGEVGSLTREELRGLVEVSGNGIVTRLNRAIGADLLQPLNWTEEQLAAIADDSLIFGAKSGQWWARQATDYSQAFGDQMRMGMLRGESLGDLMGRVKGLQEISTKNAEKLVRSSVISVANEAHLAAYQANADIMAGVEWTSTLDMKTCRRCGVLDGAIWDFSYQPIRGNTLPYPGPVAHWNCFVGDTMVVSPEVLRGFERPYSGDVVIIRTASGHEVTCTPNHPILTQAGWVAAGELHEGDEVVQRLGRERFVNPTPNSVEVETRIQDVVTSLLGSGGMVPVTVPLAPEDFHGDVTDHQVATVWTNGELGHEPDSLAGEHLCEDCLKLAGSGGVSSLPSLGRKNHAPHGWLAPFHDLPNSVGMGLAVLFGHGLPPVDQRLMTAPDGDATVPEPSSDHGSGDAQSLRYCLDAIASLVGREDVSNGHGCLVGRADLNPEQAEVALERVGLLPALIRKTLDAFPGLISLDEVVDVRRDPGFVGHVYNLETAGNWFVANTIITHNCRCSQVPVTKTWEELANRNKGLAKQLDKIPEGNRSSMGGPVSAGTTWEGWFKGLDASDQQEILGAGKYQLWEAGKLRLTDLMDQRGNELTLAELRGR